MQALKDLQRQQALRREELARDFYVNCVREAAATIAADWALTAPICATLLHRGYWLQRRGTFSALVEVWLKTQHPLVTSGVLRNPWPSIKACCKFSTSWARGFQSNHYVATVNSWIETLTVDCRRIVLEKSCTMPESVREQILSLCGLSINGHITLGFWIMFVCSVAQTSDQPVPSPSLSWKSNSRSAFLWVGEGESRDNSICGGGHGINSCDCRVLTLSVGVDTTSSLIIAHRYRVRTPLSILLVQMKCALPEVWSQYCQSPLYIQSCSSTLAEIEQLTGQPIVPERRCDLIALTIPPPSYMSSLDYTLRPPVLLLGGLNGQARDAVPPDLFHSVADRLQKWTIDGQNVVDVRLAVHRMKWGYDVPYTVDALTDDGLGDKQSQCRMLLRALMSRRMTFASYVNLKCTLAPAFQHHVICCECSHMRADALQQSGNIDPALAVKAVPSILCGHVTPHSVSRLETQTQLYLYQLNKKRKR